MVLASGLTGEGTRMAEPDERNRGIYFKVINHHISSDPWNPYYKRQKCNDLWDLHEAEWYDLLWIQCTGKMGIAIARSMAAHVENRNVVLILGPAPCLHQFASWCDPKWFMWSLPVRILESIRKAHPSADISIFSAAVADYRLSMLPGKSKDRRYREIKLIKNHSIAIEN